MYLSREHYNFNIKSKNTYLVSAVFFLKKKDRDSETSRLILKHSFLCPSLCHMTLSLSSLLLLFSLHVLEALNLEKDIDNTQSKSSSSIDYSASLIINTTVPIAISPTHLVSLGWEMHWMLSALENMTSDSRVASIMSHLAPAVVRVGGISGDWVRYVLDNVTYPPPSGPGTPTWFSEPFNVSLGTLYRLDKMLHNSGFSFALDLSELYGRSCNNTNKSIPNSIPNQWCQGSWDMRNVQAFLQRLHDDKIIGSSTNSLFAFELGNELTGHITTQTNLEDITAAAKMIRDIWSDTSTSPPLYAPAISSCGDDGAIEILSKLSNISGVTGFSFHSYPGGEGKNLTALLLDPHWLNSGVIGQTSLCLDFWNAKGGPREKGLQLWITEAASSWNWAATPPAQNSILDNFFTIAEFGQYASTGVGIVARWSFNEPNPFATIIQNNTRWEVASDYWILVAMRALLGPNVLEIKSDTNALNSIIAYAQCLLEDTILRDDKDNDVVDVINTTDKFHWRWDLSRVRHPLFGTHPTHTTSTTSHVIVGGNGNGTIVLMIANTQSFSINITLSEIFMNGQTKPLQTTPRIDYVFTAPNGDLGSISPILNEFNNGGIVLRLADDGSLPPMNGFYVPSSGTETIILPSKSQLFSVLLEAKAPACY